MMLLRQLHSCFLLAILLLVCPKTAIADEEVDIDVSADWEQSTYNNDNTEKVIQKITYVTGIKDRKSNTETLVATHNVGGKVSAGDWFKIVKLELSYSFTHQRTTADMSENEIYETRTIETTVTIPPRSTLTRWELVADVAGTKIGYDHYIDVLNDTQSTPHINISRARILLRRRINYGHTMLRIKHSERNEYINVIQSGKWPAATLGNSSSYLFVLCQDTRGIRIKTLNTTHPDLVWAYASYDEGVYFDLNQEMGDSSDSDVDKQHWSISKEEPLFGGDVVSFKNKHYANKVMCYTTDVYCLQGREDKWVLEIVGPRDDLTNSS